jgi:hypothetical protein
MRRSITVAMAVVIAVLVGWIFWPALAEQLSAGPFDLPGLGIQKLEPVW